MIGKNAKKCERNQAYIKTGALLGRGSKDIYADVYAVYGGNEVPFSTVCWKI